MKVIIIIMLRNVLLPYLIIITSSILFYVSPTLSSSSLFCTQSDNNNNNNNNNCISVKRYIYTCGYMKIPHISMGEVSNYRTMLFPNLLHNRSRYPTKKDVRLISGPGCNDFFPGITIYVDSEAGQIILTLDAIGKGLIYIGVSDQTVLNTLKLNFKEKFIGSINYTWGAINLLRADHFQHQLHVLSSTRRNENVQKEDGTIRINKGFMAYIYSNCKRIFREEIYNKFVELAIKLNIDMPVAYGKCFGNYPETIFSFADERTALSLDDDDGVNEYIPLGHKARDIDTQNLMSKHSFVLAVEATNMPWYHTEKLFNAFASGAIPIYYGSKTVFHIFRKESFIWIDPDKLNASLNITINQVKALLINKHKYNTMLKEQMLVNGAMEKYVDPSNGLANILIDMVF